jgi:hypothetical protein
MFGGKTALAGGGLLALGGLFGLGNSVRENLMGGDERKEQWREGMRQLEAKLYGQMLDRQRRSGLIEQQLMSLAQTAPDVYNRVAAGRPLPTGATVIGGGRRTDLLQQLGERMANGEFSQAS